MRRLRRANRRIGWRLVTGIAGVVGLLWLVVVAAPPWFVDDESLEGLKAQNEVRTTLLQGLAGLVLLVGAYFTYRQLHTAREGQITERYTRAIDQLGHAELDVRLGGIYALERIGRDSPDDRSTIGEVLTAFIRSHAPWPPTLPGQYVASAPIDQVPWLNRRAPDIQAILTVLGRGGFATDARLDLSDTDLRNAQLPEARLHGVHLGGANLERADLARVDLKSASLFRANLRQVNLPGANLEDATLIQADLRRAILTDANLEGAYLTGANLEDAWLTGANLEGADLGGANLAGAHLRGANLAGADRLELAILPDDSTDPR